MDGSFHAWLEGRGAEGCLIDLVDDATNTTLARLGEQETIWAVADALRAWIERYGVPLALRGLEEPVQAVCHAGGSGCEGKSRSRSLEGCARSWGSS